MVEEAQLVNDGLTNYGEKSDLRLEILYSNLLPFISTRSFGATFFWRNVPAASDEKIELNNALLFFSSHPFEN